uniref:Lipocalin/cytosolic fatty-acid binding domain-containing protein n=1 Tax=Amblyomma maculatum TaxID=34609 RepID=G3MQY6_AMBMU
MKFWNSFLHLFAVLVYYNEAAVKTQVNKQSRNTRPRSAVLPWEFISSSEIYLLRSNASMPMIKCIRAKTLSRNKNDRTLSHLVSVKTMSDKWITMNATYKPVLKGGRRLWGLFTSFDNDTGKTTHYSFSRYTTKNACAVVMKVKGSSNEGFHFSCELWLNGGFLSDSVSSALNFCHQMFESKCCTKAGQTFDARKCRDKDEELM